MRLCLLVFFALLGCTVHPRGGSVPEPLPLDVVGSLFLIGDAGAPKEDDPVLAALGRALSVVPEKSSVVFLGDNAYPSGIPDPSSDDYPVAVARLTALIDAVVDAGAPVFFLAGNHDWDRWGDSGWAAVRRQSRLIEVISGGRATMLPGNACPGPVVRAVPGFKLVALDSQWWLHEGPRPTTATDGCTTWDSAGVASRLSQVLKVQGRWNSVIVAHHPLESHGEHGGYFGLSDHLFPLRAYRSWLWLPLPFIGSAYPAARQNGINPQDQSHPLYQRYRAVIESVIGSGALAYAAGHEHSLQILDQPPFGVEIVSGAGYFGHVDAMGIGDDTRYAIAKAGFVRLDRLRTGDVRLAVVIADEDGAREVHSEMLVKPID